MLIDTHCHLNFNAFKDDVDEVIRRTLADDVWMINVGSQLETSKKAIELAERYPQDVFAAVGLHPIHVPGVADLIKGKLDPEEAAAQETVGEFNVDDYRKLVMSSQGWACPELRRRVVAIGEIGLDYYWKPKSRAKLEEFKRLQKEALLTQIDLAKELNLPIIFHCRAAHGDLIEILNTKYNPSTGSGLRLRGSDSRRLSRVESRDKILDTRLRGVIHCFTGTIEQMRQYLDMGLYLGFNGIIFKQIQGIDWQEIIKAVPLNRILVETDAPYLTPPCIGENQFLNQCKSVQKRNEPLFVKEIVKEIAKIRKLSYQEVSEITTQNARKLFNI